MGSRFPALLVTAFCLLLARTSLSHPAGALVDKLSQLETDKPEVAKAVATLRSRGLLQPIGRNLEDVAKLANVAPVRSALALLYSRHLLPDGHTTPTKFHEYFVRVEHMQNDPHPERVESVAKTHVMQMGQSNRATPYYMYLGKEKSYILGGWMPEESRCEIVYERDDEFVEIFLPALIRAFVPKAAVDPIQRPAESFQQEPEHVEMIEGPVRCWHADMRGCSLHVVQFDMGSHTLLPFVVGKFNRAHPGSLPVEQVVDVVQRYRAIAGINGTFFINTPSSYHHGRPLAPIIVEGREAWSHNEQRVLNRKRTYIAVTNTNRLVAGETAMSARDILWYNAHKKFDPNVFHEEKIRHLMGGLGWLIKDGDTDAWRAGIGKQFETGYYSHYVQRPQSVVAFDKAGRRGWLIAQEGRPHSTRPMPLPELAHYVDENLHAPWAMFLDGGGSTTLCFEGERLTRPEENGGYRKVSTMLLVMPNRE